MGQGSYPHFQSVLLPPGKARRLKQAKEEAQMEVDQYRREREQEFQSKQQAAMGSQGNLSAEVEQATRRQVQGMQSSQQRNQCHTPGLCSNIGQIMTQSSHLLQKT